MYLKNRCTEAFCNLPEIMGGGCGGGGDVSGGDGGSGAGPEPGQSDPRSLSCLST